MGGQNFAVTFEESKTGRSLLESVRIPCTILFYPHSRNATRFVEYCHFDERNLYELRTFVDTSKDSGLDRIALFGGYGSKTIISLAKYIGDKGLGRLMDKDFVSSPPIDEIFIDKEKIIFGCVNRDRTVYSYGEFAKLFGLG